MPSVSDARGYLILPIATKCWSVFSKRRLHRVIEPKVQVKWRPKPPRSNSLTGSRSPHMVYAFMVSGFQAHVLWRRCKEECGSSWRDSVRRSFSVLRAGTTIQFNRNAGFRCLVMEPVIQVNDGWQAHAAVLNLRRHERARGSAISMAQFAPVRPRVGYVKSWLMEHPFYATW